MSGHVSCAKGKPAWFDEASIPALCFIGRPIPAIILPILISLLFAVFKWKQYQNLQRQSLQPEKPLQHEDDQLRDRHSLSMELLRITAFMIPLGLSFLVANYLTTCIGWLPLLGFEIETPSLTGGYYLGCFVFLAAWMIMSIPAQLKGDHRRAKRRPWKTFVQESAFDAEAVCWATISQLVLWLICRATATY